MNAQEPQEYLYVLCLVWGFVFLKPFVDSVVLMDRLNQHMSDLFSFFIFISSLLIIGIEVWLDVWFIKEYSCAWSQCRTLTVLFNQNKKKRLPLNIDMMYDGK